MTETVWRADFNRAATALTPWVGTDPDGFRYVLPTAPAGLLSVYRGLVQIGYANGWME